MSFPARSLWIRPIASLGVAALIACASAPSPVVAADEPDAAANTAAETSAAPRAEGAAEFPARAAVRALIEKETATTQLPADIAEAVVFVESRYDSTVVGRVGEVGLMQVRPETAAMLGFKGTTAELAKPEINIHYGVTYLAEAWRLARGDLCRALMKYRAGHGEETMTPRSVIYCNRARNRLLAMNSAFAAPGAVAAVALDAAQPSATTREKPQASHTLPRPADVYARYRQGTPAASQAYWTVQEARVRAIKARIEAKWRRVASR